MKWYQQFSSGRGLTLQPARSRAILCGTG